MRASLARLSLAALFTLVTSTFVACSDEPSADPDGGVDAGPGTGEEGGTSSGTSGGPGSDGGADADAGPPRVVNITKETMEYEGRTRTYILAVPKDRDAAKSYPLVMSFHGNPGSAEGQSQYLPFDLVSGSEAIIVYPDAIANNWDLYTPTDTNNDMNWIFGLIDELKAKVNVDPDRIYGFGFSGGSFFIPQMTCRFGAFFRAVAINAGGGPEEAQMGYEKREDGCYVCPGGPVTALVIHGQDDNVVELASGSFTAACLAQTNECEEGKSPAEPAPCRTYDSCAKPLKTCFIPGLGHAIWDQGMKEAWSFFKAAP